MKTVTLVRHAKSSWDHSHLHDFDRPLSERGLRDAPEMSRRLNREGIVPDRIVSSPAIRALTTARILAGGTDLDTDTVTTEGRLYGADGAEIVAVIRALDDRLEHVLLVGHNPGFTDVANRLSGMRFRNVPTCGVVSIRFPCASWREVDDHMGECAYTDYPKKERA